jgi:hypothetical protein
VAIQFSRCRLLMNQRGIRESNAVPEHRFAAGGGVLGRTE